MTAELLQTRVMRWSCYDYGNSEKQTCQTYPYPKKNNPITYRSYSYLLIFENFWIRTVPHKNGADCLCFRALLSSILGCVNVNASCLPILDSQNWVSIQLVHSPDPIENVLFGCIDKQTLQFDYMFVTSYFWQPLLLICFIRVIANMNTYYVI